MSYNTDRRTEVAYVISGANEYVYLEFPVTQQESIYGFHLEIEANKLTGAGAMSADVLVGMAPMNPVTETAGNTLYDVNAPGAAARNLGTFDLDFTTFTTNRILVTPGAALGAAALPDPLPPVFGIYIKYDGLRISNVYKSRGV